MRTAPQVRSLDLEQARLLGERAELWRQSERDLGQPVIGGYGVGAVGEGSGGLLGYCGRRSAPS